jgi:putative ABC transport system permease protein
VASIRTNFAAAGRSLVEQWQRTVLSAVGIMVGCVAIVLLISIARGVQEDLGRQVDGLGVNLLIVMPGRLTEGSMLSPNLAGLSYLQDEDIERVRKVEGVRRAAPLMFVGGGLSRDGQDSPTTLLIAASSDWFAIHRRDLEEGRFFGPEEEDQPVCVIGSIAARHLFGDASPVGKELEVNGLPYRVVGVTKDPETEESMFSMASFANVAYIPYRYVVERVPNPQINRIMIQTEPEREPEQVLSSVEAALEERLDRQQFSVLTQRNLLDLLFKVMSILTWLLTGLTSIALFVGGVGIMTVMLMSVNERSKEIGIRKTVGGRRGDVFAQFLSEALLVATAGALVGLALSYVVCLGLYHYTPIKPLITLSTVGLAIGVCLLVGAVFGVLPAMKAARQDPVVALRNE